MKKFQCLATHRRAMNFAGRYGHFYAYSHYDLESSDPNEIMVELKERGFDDLIEIWDVEAQ